MDWFLGVHKGSYRGMTETFMALGKELAARRDLVPVYFGGLEIYRDPGSATTEAITEIGFAVVRT
jgi:hypothetical protein